MLPTLWTTTSSEYRAVPEYGGALARDGLSAPLLSAPLFTGHCAPARRVRPSAWPRLLSLGRARCLYCVRPAYCDVTLCARTTARQLETRGAVESMARDHCVKAHLLWYRAYKSHTLIFITRRPRLFKPIMKPILPLITSLTPK